jgi:hypothetical protein
MDGFRVQRRDGRNRDDSKRKSDDGTQGAKYLIAGSLSPAESGPSGR